MYDDNKQETDLALGEISYCHLNDAVPLMSQVYSGTDTDSNTTEVLKVTVNTLPNKKMST